MRTSGLVLDVYDDFEGSTLRSLYPSLADIPERVKMARTLDSEDRARLPDDVFALVLENEGEKIRKYACVDEGNTTLSVQFFLKNAHKLPHEAQVRGAENLKVACSWYGITPPPELEKIALGAAPILAGVASIPVLSGTAHEMGGRHAAVNALGGSDGTIITPAQRDEYRAQMMKGAEITGSSDAPISGPAGKTPAAAQTVVKKVAMPHLVAGHRGTGASFGPEETERPVSMKEKMPERLPQARVMHPHVDISNKEAPKVTSVKSASRYALPGRFPLDSYAQVQAATEYFGKYASMFSPQERRGYCVEMVKRAGELGIPVSEVARKYAATTYAPEEEIKTAHALRRTALGDNPDACLLLDELFEKRAAFEPDAFCAVLEEFDKVAHLDFAYNSGVPDPYYSTYGEKTATDDKDWSYSLGNDFVTKRDLYRYAFLGLKAMKNVFNDDIAKEFHKDPISTFKKLSLHEKKIVMRMATDNAAGLGPTA